MLTENMSEESLTISLIAVVLVLVVLVVLIVACFKQRENGRFGMRTRQRYINRGGRIVIGEV